MMTAILAPAAMGPVVQATADMRPTYRKVTLRLVPLLFICYFFNYFDRVNVGYAKLQMLGDLHMSETAFGLGAGIFFIGYIVCGVPSNLILYKVGARRWLAATMVLWGIGSASLMFVSTAGAFYTLRLLTGAAEAGFFPGVILYFTYWFPSAQRGWVSALFMSAIPISGLIGSPFSGWILSAFANGSGGLAGWQWLYLLEGLPTIPLGIALYFFLSDGIDRAKWLNPIERAALKDALAEDEKHRPPGASASFASVLRNRNVWLAGVIYFCIEAGVYSINFWMPTIIKESGIGSAMAIGWLSAIPYLAASVFMVVVGRSADARRERRWHIIVPMLMGTIGLVIAANFAANTMVATASLTLAAMGALAALAMFWPLSSTFLTASAAAGGLALINSCGALAGFVGPYLVGWLQDATQSTDLALYILAGVMLAGATLVLCIPAKTVDR
jgi:MFS family permease